MRAQAMINGRSFDHDKNGNAGTAGAGPAQVTRPSEDLTFTFGSEEYGVEMLKVQEIRGRRGHSHCQCPGIYQGRGESARHDRADRR